ncbi:unnamed protein product [Discula destructiva]
MAAMIPRTAIWALLALVTFLSLPRGIFFPSYPREAPPSFPEMIAESLGTYSETGNVHHSHEHNHEHNHEHSSSLPPSPSQQKISPTETYFDQVFSLTTPQHPYAFPALRKQCAHTKWRSKDALEAKGGSGGGSVYLQCEGIYLGLTSVISQVKSCLKMAIEAGAGVILPDIPLRAADNLLAYNQGNHDAERPFGAWFDQSHLVAVMKDACPGLEIVTPRDVREGGRVKVKNTWGVDIHAARYFRERDGYFWAGKPFAAFFEESLARLREEHKDDQQEDENGDDREEGGLHNQLARRTTTTTTITDDGATIIGMRADFELFSVTSDPTGHDRLLWDDLGRTLRFLEEPRAIVDKMLTQLGALHDDDDDDDDDPQQGQVFFAVHFRGEGDNMWAEPAEQIRVDLDALDAAWEMYRHDEGVAPRGGDKDRKPPVYLACGNEESLDAFVAAGAGRGWNVTSKYALAKSMESSETFDMIEELPFDFQAIIDMGLLVKSYFFIGIMGSAFSYTVANLRDPTTRYRGSSFDVWHDGGARTHMFPNNDRYGDTTMEKYACCL